MAEDKKSFVVYHDIKAILDKLSDEQVGKLFRAMVSQSMGEIVPEFDDLVLDIAFTPIRQQMDRDAEKWDDIKEKRAEAGRRGGLKSAEKRAQANQANANFASVASQANPSKQANQAVTVTGNVNVNGTVTETDTTTVTVPSGGRYKCDDDFNIWKRLTPEDIDVLYEKFPNSGGLLIDAVYEDVKAKKTKVKSGLKYILGYAKNVGWDDNADHFNGGGMS